MDAWCRREGLDRGGVLTIDQTWKLAIGWYRDRMSPSWRRRTLEEAQALFDEIGMTGPFWQLAAETR